MSEVQNPSLNELKAAEIKRQTLALVDFLLANGQSSALITAKLKKFHIPIDDEIQARINSAI